MFRSVLRRRLMGLERCYLNQLLLSTLEFKMDELKAHKIIPDVIDEQPQHPLKVKYKDYNVEAMYGNVLTPTQVKSEPTLDWDAEADKFYTVLMVDPDAPSRSSPIFREWQHWLVVNVPGNNISEGEVKTPYIGAGPPEGTGLHRYVFLVYEQTRRLSFPDVPKLRRDFHNRGKFSTREFIRKHSYRSLAAANFFQAEWDEYVPQMHK